ncbi:hypothetical protein [Streptomyces sp. NPDC017988]|uniref:hypothetical protein n=1 Tax=Streptomyces sp. NPDC017988 TaxID=3365025 RepID=UPI0037A0D43F
MVMKRCPPEFKADAVALYESRPEATIKQTGRCRSGDQPEDVAKLAREAGGEGPRGRRVVAVPSPVAPASALKN